MPTTVTKTVKPSGGDYTSLSAWEAGEQGNLVSLDEIRQAECYSMADTTAVVIDGSTTDATRYMRVYTPTSERHDGKYNTAKYRIEVTNPPQNTGAVTISDGFVRLEGLQTFTTVSGVSLRRFGIVAGYDYTLTANQTVRISHCVVRGSSSGSDTNEFHGIRCSEGNGFATYGYIHNCVVYGFRERGGYTGGGRGVQFANNADTAMTVYCHNVTVYDCTYGFHQGHTTSAATVKNCLAQDNGDGFSGSGTFLAASTNNCSDIASDAPGSNPSTGEVTFVDEGGADFHLAGTDAFARDFGTDLSGDANLAFSDDIDGVARSGTWDIGADEYVLVARPSFQVRHTRPASFRPGHAR